MGKIFRYSALLFCMIFSSESSKALVVVHEHHGGIQTLYNVSSTPRWYESLGTGLGHGLVALANHKVKEIEYNKQMVQYTEMFLNLGYSNSQAKAYAKLCVDNPGGYAAVLANIERENELKYQQAHAQKMMQQQIKAQYQLAELQHQQKLNQIKQQQDFDKKTYEKIIGLLIIAMILGLGFLGILIYEKFKH